MSTVKRGLVSAVYQAGQGIVHRPVRLGHPDRRGDAGGPPVELLVITLVMMIFALIALAVLAVNVFQAMDSVP
jgi:hypothetical protein